MRRTLMIKLVITVGRITSKVGIVPNEILMSPHGSKLKVRFDFSDRRLELACTFSYPTYSELSESVNTCLSFVKNETNKSFERILVAWRVVQLPSLDNATYSPLLKTLHADIVPYDMPAYKLYKPRNLYPFPEVLFLSIRHPHDQRLRNAVSVIMPESFGIPEFPM
ncbi:hypothetical protein Tco_0019054 [Tanacetum coccineum]